MVGKLLHWMLQRDVPSHERAGDLAAVLWSSLTPSGQGIEVHNVQKLDFKI